MYNFVIICLKKNKYISLMSITKEKKMQKQSGRDMQKKAFTLSEVLIALTVIGVISALTVPALMQKTQKQEYVFALKKAYSILSQVTQRIIAEEGSPRCQDDSGAAIGGWACSAKEIYEMYKKHLNNAKECGTSDGCLPQFINTKYKYLDGSKINSDWEASSIYYVLVLADGVQVIFDPYMDKKCKAAGYGTSNYCSRIHVDINGAKKPNQMGRDYFQFVIKENGLYPRGVDSGTAINKHCGGVSSAPGINCAARVLLENAMNY